jgi:hypothetical protein
VEALIGCRVGLKGGMQSSGTSFALVGATSHPTPLLGREWGRGGLGPGCDSLLPPSVHLQLHGLGTCVWLPG